ncbi:MAG: cofactor-independent phosphoglycerate mutase [Chloroflexi bacterium]|nr:cofactor-independent phosphoglycerate mutase [Chloroflexota bacterium]
MKYCVLIMDGASGRAIPERGGQTSLGLAHTPNLDKLVRQGTVGLTRTIPTGMEPSSACGCMSIMGYDPKVYYKGRGGIEARSLGIPVADDEVVFRCNLVAIRDGQMWDYSAGHISTGEARELISALNDSMGNTSVTFYPGVGYRHICKIRGHRETLQATCTPPHDIPNRPVAGFLPAGPGSQLLLDLMKRSEPVLQIHPVNQLRKARGEVPATTIWLFWGTGRIPEMPPFQKLYGVRAAMTSGVDLLGGLARMAGMAVLDIPGVTDGPDNDYAGQVAGALNALEEYDLVFVHIETPDEAGHHGSTMEKVAAIEIIDKEVVSRVMAQRNLRLLVMPDHPTPIEIRTHCDDPVPFLLWGDGFAANGAGRFTEAEAKKTGFFIGEGHELIGRLTAG